MLTSRTVIPKEFIKSRAFVYVRSVVPNPGIVTPIISLRDHPNLSKVLTHTSNANVESNPPEMPTTALLAAVCTRRWAKPETCIENISSQRSFNSTPCGTKGWGSKQRVRFSSLLFTYSVKTRTASPGAQCARQAEKVVLTRRSVRKCSTSISLIITCPSKEKRLLRAIRLPFSKISPFPANTTSVVDSPNPHEQKT